MRTVIDKNVVLGLEAFSTLGEVVALPGREIDKSVLRNAHAFCGRTVTKVNADLLRGTTVKYVGTATIGMDHYDEAWLKKTGIRYTNAPGCNADSVGDYLTASLLWIAERGGKTLKGKTIGVVGCGNVGSRVVKRAKGLGMKVIENDPPLARRTGDPRYRPLDEVFEADYITVHVPLTREGEDATFHMIDEAFFARMRSDAIFMNSSRGEVVDETALKAALREGRIADAALDVWENEPRADRDLVDQVLIATPHIAGYSFDGKVNATRQVYEKFCEWTGVVARWDPRPFLPEPDVPVLEIDASGRSDEDVLRETAYAVYDVKRDDAAMREAMRVDDPDARWKAFDRLRNEYPRRREFSLTTVHLRNGSKDLAARLRGIGFRVESLWAMSG
ncbi:4-phosphoerythronate dehydrogenase [Candidatus Sumerlaeota bacterium]|nr:4-phosphoerythronate dehydrogenase [Candidatus Sumerlaeota bacterium]